MLVGNRTLLADEGIDLGLLAAVWDELAGSGRAALLVAVDGGARAVMSWPTPRGKPRPPQSQPRPARGRGAQDSGGWAVTAGR